MVGTAAGALTHAVSFSLAAVMLGVALLLQVATNTGNEYFDYAHGLDDDASVGIAGVIVSGAMSARTVLSTTIGVYGAAFVLGLILVVARGPLLLVLGLFSIGMGIMYNAGPKPVSATPFGEAFVFIMMGPLEVAVSEVAATAVFTWAAVAASIPVGALVAAILLANNLRDRETDARHGRRTLAITFGTRTAGRLLLGLFAFAAAWPILAVGLGLLPLSPVSSSSS